ncbi:MAG TPA: CAP domain-containing protein, partial [Pseudolysinimonas sp.]
MVRSRTIFLGGVAVVFAVLLAVVWIVTSPGSATPDSPAVAGPQPSPKASLEPAPTPIVSPAATSPANAPGGGGSSGTCTSVFTCVNIERTSRGISALSTNSTLSTAAQNCADRMAASGEMTHSSGPPSGFSTWGENIAVGYPSASSVVAAWMASSGHRANILNPAYHRTGVGYV